MERLLGGKPTVKLQGSVTRTNRTEVPVDGLQHG